MRDRFDVFLEALKQELKKNTTAFLALNNAIEAVEIEDTERERIEKQTEEDIHYQDRYGKD